MFMGCSIGLEIEMGLVCCQWLLRKLKITVSGAKLLHMQSASHFCLQQLTPFGSSFNFPDPVNTPKLIQRQKCYASRISNDNFLGGSALVKVLHQDRVFSFLGNHRPHSSPVSIFQTNSTPLITCKDRKYYAARIGDSEFE
jgi:hypothetical protein